MLSNNQMRIVPSKLAFFLPIAFGMVGGEIGLNALTSCSN